MTRENRRTTSVPRDTKRRAARSLPLQHDKLDPVPAPSGAEQAPRPVVEIIRALQAKELSARMLVPDDRRRCVEYLTAEGYSCAEIAGVLGVADRTVLRDRQALRRANAVERDPAFLGEMVGHLLREADTVVARIRRVSREKGTPSAVRVDAERTCWAVARDLVGLLQRLGYLPEAAREVRAELTHRVGDVAEYDELAVELERLEAIHQRTGVGDEVVVSGLGEVRSRLTRLVASEQLEVLAAAIDTEVLHEDDDTESQ